MKKLSPSQALNRPLIRTDDSTYYGKHEGLESTRRLGFRIGNIGLLIGEQATCELSEVLQICTIPFTAAWLLGLINLRGNLVPVFDLYQLLQLETGKGIKKMLLILGREKTAGAIVIEELPIHLTFTENDKLTHLPPLPAIIKPYASSGYEKESTVWFNFDHLGFFETLTTKLAL
ncbi:MAG: chemotaxis protein CheW [Thiomargarita sp.]|jgi:chemotaxis signal transduction protein|nr:chemotaxis protein CheW [Thiomargarita sp.]